MIAHMPMHPLISVASYGLYKNVDTVTYDRVFASPVRIEF